MIAALKKPLSLVVSIVICSLIASCTDRRPLVMPPQEIFEEVEVPTISAAADIFFGDQPLLAYQMATYRGSLYVTGKPFGLMRMNISANPEDPTLVYAISDNLNEFSDIERNGPWVVDWYASGSLTIANGRGYSTGTLGMSVFQADTPVFPRELSRTPKFDEDRIVRDEAFLYDALLALPYGLAGFGRDYIYNIGIDSVGGVQLLNRDRYEAESICCVGSAAYFRGKVYLALRSRLWILSVAGNRIISPVEFTKLRVVHAFANKKHVFLEHLPLASDLTSEYPEGIYVFDTSGNFVVHLPITPERFVVNDASTHIYTSRSAEQNIRVYRILWENIGR